MLCQCKLKVTIFLFWGGNKDILKKKKKKKKSVGVKEKI
jgi:hypothetical protein